MKTDLEVNYTKEKMKPTIKIGRPANLDNPETMALILKAFAIGATDEESCASAKISLSALYDYQSKHPDFLDKKNRLKQMPILTARQTVVDGLEGNPEFALKYLERKKKDEFGTRQEITGANGKELINLNEILEHV